LDVLPVSHIPFNHLSENPPLNDTGLVHVAPKFGEAPA
jgi:hypothetical protein